MATVDEKMENEHGSVGKALRVCFEKKMSTADIARKYGCSDNYIGRKIHDRGLVNPNDGRSRSKESLLGITSCESRKAMTAAIRHGEEYYRERMIAEQVTIYKPGDPLFDLVAADTLRQRETCQRQAFTLHLWRD